jgi:hypothetical protein
MRSSGFRRKSIIVPILIVALVGVFALVGALSDAHKSKVGGSSAPAPRAGALTTEQGAGKVVATPLPADAAVFGANNTAMSASSAVAPDGTQMTNLDLATIGPNFGRSLIRNGDITLIVDKGSLGAVVNRVITLTDGMRGYIVSTYLGTAAGTPPYPMPVDGKSGTASSIAVPDLPAGDPYASITVRVPARSFDAAVARLSSLGKVTQMTTSSEDVTGQVVDLRARLRHYQAVEERLLSFLVKATTVSETLQVQDRIDRTQLTIEELQGELKQVDQQVAYSMISITATEHAVHAKPAASTNTFTGSFWNSLKVIGHGAKVTFVALGAVLPFAALLAAVCAVILLLGRHWARNRPQPLPPTTQLPQTQM